MIITTCIGPVTHVNHKMHWLVKLAKLASPFPAMLINTMYSEYCWSYFEQLTTVMRSTGSLCLQNFSNKTQA
jgi:hypothetical protein